LRIYFWVGMVAIDTRRSKSRTTLFNENAGALLNNHGQIHQRQGLLYGGTAHKYSYSNRIDRGL
jgi:hypothetical protein